MATGSYRGHSSISPVAPYAFTSTPVILNAANPLRQHPTVPILRQENRTSSIPATPLLPSPSSYANAAKPSPDRYRRSNRRAEPVAQAPSPSPQNGSASPSGSGMAPVGHLYNNPSQTSGTPTLTSYPAFRGSQSAQNIHELPPSSTVRLLSADDLSLPRQSAVEQAKRYRRRSISSLEMKEHIPQTNDLKVQSPLQQKIPAAVLVDAEDRSDAPSPPILQRPSSSHGRNGSTGSTSTSSGRSSSRPSSV